MKKALIIGSSGGIGKSLVNLLEDSGDFKVVKTHYRSKLDNSYFLDITSEKSCENFVEQLESDLFFDLIIFAHGFLGQKPERSINDFSIESISDVLKVNTLGPLFLIRNLKKFIPRKDESTILFLSAKVGSITDNELGGWYGYRMSKSALNMGIKNLSIEFKRNGYIKTRFLAVHPGTTHTELSKNFLSNIKHRIWDSDDTAKHLINIYHNQSIRTGSFVNWDQSLIEW